MNAQKLADELKALGINVINVTEPQEHEDGIIAVTDKVHVQVPMYSDYGAGVVRETLDGDFELLDERDTTQ